jgi:uncharacterized repeat protein (TIGR02543 family)
VTATLRLNRTDVGSASSYNIDGVQLRLTVAGDAAYGSAEYVGTDSFQDAMTINNYTRPLTNEFYVDWLWASELMNGVSERTARTVPNPLTVSCTFTVTDPTNVVLSVKTTEIYVHGSATCYEASAVQRVNLALDANGGTLSGNSVAGSYYPGRTVTLPTPTRSGYTFAGWSDGTTNHPAGDYTVPDSAVKLTAQWTCAHASTKTTYTSLDNGFHTITVTCTNTSCTDATRSTTNEACTLTQQYDTDGHWSQCSLCGYKTAQAGHSLVDNVCSVCGYQAPATDDKTDDNANNANNSNNANNGNNGNNSNSGTNGGSTNVSVSTTTSTVANTVIDGNTETVTYEDGSTTTVETAANGTVTTTQTTAAGVTGVTVKDQSGAVTSVSATIPATVATAAAQSGEAVSLPLNVQAAQSSAAAPAIAVNVPSTTKSVKVEIPVENVSLGVVAVVVNADGSEEIDKTSIVTDTGVELAVSGSTTVKIVDNTKTFDDVASTYWGNDAITFATARTIFNGTSSTTFTPEGTMTRGMLAKVLHNLESSPEAVSLADFLDVSDDAWYAEAVAWAAETGIVTGYGDGTFGPTDDVTRQQVAVMLWRYAGQPTVSTNSINTFGDADSVSTYAQQAMAWCIENGIINGINGNLNPNSNATRTQVATMMMRYCTVLAK